MSYGLPPPSCVPCDLFAVSRELSAVSCELPLPFCILQCARQRAPAVSREPIQFALCNLIFAMLASARTCRQLSAVYFATKSPPCRKHHPLTQNTYKCFLYLSLSFPLPLPLFFSCSWVMMFNWLRIFASHEASLPESPSAFSR